MSHVTYEKKRKTVDFGIEPCVTYRYHGSVLQCVAACCSVLQNHECRLWLVQWYVTWLKRVMSRVGALGRIWVCWTECSLRWVDCVRTRMNNTTHPHNILQPRAHTPATYCKSAGDAVFTSTPTAFTADWQKKSQKSNSYWNYTVRIVVRYGVATISRLL